jgi:hypothetical protein
MFRVEHAHVGRGNPAGLPLQIRPRDADGLVASHESQWIVGANRQARRRRSLRFDGTGAHSGEEDGGSKRDHEVAHRRVAGATVCMSA